MRKSVIIAILLFIGLFLYTQYSSAKEPVTVPDATIKLSQSCAGARLNQRNLDKINTLGKYLSELHYEAIEVISHCDDDQLSKSLNRSILIKMVLANFDKDDIIEIIKKSKKEYVIIKIYGTHEPKALREYIKKNNL